MAVFHDGRLAARISLVSFESDDPPFALEWAHGPLLMEDERRFADLDAVVEVIERRCGERRSETGAVGEERRQYARRTTDRVQTRDHATPVFTGPDAHTDAA